MRSLGERLHLLRKLISLRCGPGAAILPPEVTRIHMDFALKIHGGHMGPRKFFNDYLPRLKYHNPSVPMIVNRHNVNDRPPTITIYFRTAPKPDAADAADAAAAETPSQTVSSRNDLSKAQPPAPDERVVRIDMKNKKSSDILEFFMAETRAEALQPVKEDISEMQDLEAMRKKAVVDRERVRILRDEKKKEQEMLRRAREAVGMGESEAA